MEAGLAAGLRTHPLTCPDSSARRRTTNRRLGMHWLPSSVQSRPSMNSQFGRRGTVDPHPGRQIGWPRHAPDGFGQPTRPEEGRLQLRRNRGILQSDSDCVLQPGYVPGTVQQALEIGHAARVQEITQGAIQGHGSFTSLNSNGIACVDDPILEDELRRWPDFFLLLLNGGP